MPTLDKETHRLLNAARTQYGLVLSHNQLLRLCAVVAHDLGLSSLVEDFAPAGELANGYFRTPISWFEQPVSPTRSLEEVFLSVKAAQPDAATYFRNLSMLHKRRLKFKTILGCQPFPKMEQIVPRSLLEYGTTPSEVLATWLVWRKWLYDLDNRAAQETGYLFEPILADAIGGVPYSAQQSPIKRADDPSKGRQVDCIDDSDAYEFKMRVTIAASGQGRFREELEFARDCSTSGFRPILLVLDPTPSARLGDLAAEYARYGGSAYIGNDAWQLIESKAGPVMASFVEKYVRVPISEVDSSYVSLQALRLEKAGNDAVQVQIGEQAFTIMRLSDDVCRGTGSASREGE
jgi:hypothetical protein